MPASWPRGSIPWLMTSFPSDGYSFRSYDVLHKQKPPSLWLIARSAPHFRKTVGFFVRSLAIFFWDFRFWEGQKEEINRGYLQFASYICEKERAHQASRMGERIRVQGYCRSHLARSERVQ